MIKKIILFLLLCVSSPSMAQLYIQPYAGYMFSTNPYKRETVMTINEIENSFTTKFKYSEGVTTGIVVGYTLKNNICLELNASAQVLSRFGAFFDLPANFETLSSFYVSGFIGNVNYKSNVFQFAPQIGYNITKDKFSVSLKIGPNFLQSKITTKGRSIYTWQPNSEGVRPTYDYEETETTGNKFSVGLRSSLGLDYKVSSIITLCLNFVSVYGNFQFTDSKIKAYAIDGINSINTLASTTSKLPDTSEYRFDFGQVGVTLGVKYTFQKNNTNE